MFCNFSDYIGFTYLPDSCHQIAKCQPTQCRPTNSGYLKLTSHIRASAFCHSWTQTQMKCRNKERWFGLLRKMLKVLDGADQ